LALIRIVLLAAALGGLLALPLGGSGSRAQSSSAVTIYFFWIDGCPYCAEARPVLEELVRRHPGSELRDYEVGHSEANATLFVRMAWAHGFEPSSVPTFFLGERHWIGYGPRVATQIEQALVACLANGCPDAATLQLPPAGGTPPPAPAAGDGATELVELPLLGEVDLADQSLWVSTVLIAFVDGFNPCSLWVLSILVALSLRTGSRRKVLTIGLIYITVTAGVYALFIAGLFTVLSVASLAGWIQVAVALVALFFGAVNVKDYFYYREGLSFTIDERHKPGLYQRMRRTLTAGESFWGMAGATVVLAAGVSLIEFSCTAGFPVLWTNLLASQGVTALSFALLLLLYLLVYQLDELAVFLTAVFTLKARRVSERQGRVLKLLGGTLMLTLAGVMLVDPALMNSLRSSLAIFGLAFVATGLVLLLHRRILPRFGIRIGNEAPPGRPPA